MSLPPLTFAEVAEEFTHIDETRQPSILACSISIMTICTIAVALRLWARHLQKLKLAWNDYIIMATLVPVLAMCSLSIYGESLGIGKHAILVGRSGAEMAARLLYILEAVFHLTNWLAKVSLLLLYESVFGGTGNRVFNISVRILIAAWTALDFAGSFTSVFQCWPIPYAWTTNHAVQCLDLRLAILILTIIAVVLNCATLFLPIPFVWKLHLPGYKKLGIIMIFILGVGDLSVSIYRAIITARINTNDFDVTWIQVRQLNLALLEPGIALICACIPTLLPVFRLFWRGIDRLMPGQRQMKSWVPAWSLAPVSVFNRRKTGSGVSSERTRVGEESIDHDKEFEMLSSNGRKDIESLGLPLDVAHRDVKQSARTNKRRSMGRGWLPSFTSTPLTTSIFAHIRDRNGSRSSSIATLAPVNPSWGVHEAGHAGHGNEKPDQG